MSEAMIRVGPVPMMKILSVWNLASGLRFIFHGDGLFSFEVPADHPLAIIDWEQVEYYVSKPRHYEEDSYD